MSLSDIVEIILGIILFWITIIWIFASLIDATHILMIIYLIIGIPVILIFRFVDKKRIKLIYWILSFLFWPLILLDLIFKFLNKIEI